VSFGDFNEKSSGRGGVDNTRDIHGGKEGGQQIVAGVQCSVPLVVLSMILVGAVDFYACYGR